MWAVSGQFSRPVAPRQHRLGRKGREGSPSPSAERQAPGPTCRCLGLSRGGGGGAAQSCRSQVGGHLAGGEAWACDQLQWPWGCGQGRQEEAQPRVGSALPRPHLPHETQLPFPGGASVGALRAFGLSPFAP